MKNENGFKYYKYSYPSLGSKIINFLLALAANAVVIVELVLPIFIATALVIDKILYKKIKSEYGFIICISIFLFMWIAFDLLYIFTKKGVYIFYDNKIVIKNGYFVRGNFYSLRGIKYSFYTWQIKNINIYSDKRHFKAWETQMYIPKFQYYIIIELVNNNRIAFSLEDNFGFVDEVVKRKKQ